MANDKQAESPPDEEKQQRRKPNPPQWLVVFVEESDEDNVPIRMTTKAGPMDRVAAEKKAAGLGTGEDVEDGTDILCIRLGLRGKRGTKKKIEREVTVKEIEVPAFQLT